MNTEIKFKGRTIKDNRWVTGYYVVTPLTDGDSGLPQESGWFFLTGEIKHCIIQNSCAYVVDPATVSLEMSNESIRAAANRYSDKFDPEYQEKAYEDFYEGVLWTINHKTETDETMGNKD